MLPFPLAIAAHAMLAMVWVALGKNPRDPSLSWPATAVEAVIVIACLSISLIILHAYRIPIRRLTNPDADAADAPTNGDNPG
jgi:hypothetical protein